MTTGLVVLMPSALASRALIVSVTTEVDGSLTRSLTVSPRAISDRAVAASCAANDTTGAVRSTSGVGARTVHVAVAGVGSTVPAASRARTSSECAPGASWAIDSGDTQAANAAPSSEHSNVADGLFDTNVTCTGPAATDPVGAPPVI